METVPRRNRVYVYLTKKTVLSPQDLEKVAKIMRDNGDKEIHFSYTGYVLRPETDEQYNKRLKDIEQRKKQNELMAIRHRETERKSAIRYIKQLKKRHNLDLKEIV